MRGLDSLIVDINYTRKLSMMAKHETTMVSIKDRSANVLGSHRRHSGRETCGHAEMAGDDGMLSSRDDPRRGAPALSEARP